MQKVDELVTVLRQRREQWKAAHPSEPFPGIATLQPHPDTSGIVVASVFQTMAYTGYPNIDVMVGGRPIATRAMIPGPPCDGRTVPCPPAQAGDHVHAQGDATSWRIVTFGASPLDESNRSPASPSRFRERLTEVTKSRSVREVTFHIATNAPFSSMAPYLEALAATRDRLGLDAPLTLSVRDIAQAGPRSNDVPTPVGAPSPSSSARLDPKVIQQVVRQSFGDFRHCYEEALRDNPNAQGRVVVRFVIATDGHVSTAQAAVDESLPDEVGPCIEEAFAKLTFPEPNGGIVTVSYPIVFTPGG